MQTNIRNLEPSMLRIGSVAFLAGIVIFVISDGPVGFEHYSPLYLRSQLDNRYELPFIEYAEVVGSNPSPGAYYRVRNTTKPMKAKNPFKQELEHTNCNNRQS